jgi:hypothetical protein
VFSQWQINKNARLIRNGLSKVYGEWASWMGKFNAELQYILKL